MSNTQRKVKLENIKRSVRRIHPGFSTTDKAFQTSVVLLAARTLGPNIKRIASFTGYSRDFVSSVSQRARSRGVWNGANVDTTVDYIYA